MDLIFKFGEHYYEGGDSSFWLQLTITFIGAFLGFLSALWVSNKNARKLKLEKIEYLKVILDSILKSTKKQLSHFEEFITELKANPYHLNQAILLATNDVHRYLKFDTQVLFSYFLNISKSNSAIEDFNKINAYIDHFDLAFKLINTDVERYKNSTYKRQIFIKESIEKISNELANVLDGVSIDAPTNYRQRPDWIFLNQQILNYHSFIANGDSIDDILSNYVNPLRQGIINNNYHHNLELNNILVSALNAYVAYNDIKVESEGLADDLEKIISKLEDTYNKLEETLKITLA